MEMKKNGKVVLLKAKPETILNRVKDSDERPLLNGNKNVEFIEKMMEGRREKYEAAADICGDGWKDGVGNLRRNDTKIKSGRKITAD